jgi:hypothetical protein
MLHGDIPLLSIFFCFISNTTEIPKHNKCPLLPPNHLCTPVPQPQASCARLLREGSARSTTARYNSSVASWCWLTAHANMQPSVPMGDHMFAWPTPQNLALFVGYRADIQVAPQTIRGDISAVRRAAQWLSIPCATAAVSTQLPPMVNALIAAHERRFAISPAGERLRTVHARLPITTSILRQMLAAAPQCLSPFRAARFTAFALLAFFGCLRSGELLCPSSGAWDPSSHTTTNQLQLCASPRAGYLLIIRVSKTDPKRIGREIFYPAQIGDFNILLAASRWFQHRVSAAGPCEALFTSEGGLPCTADMMRKDMADICNHAHLPLPVGKLHSFRQGAATTLAAAQVSDASIQAFGGWESDSFNRYVKMTPSARQELQSLLAGAAF